MARDDGPRSRRSIDARTRALGSSDSVDPAWFWTEEWPRVMELNGERAAGDAARLNLPPLTIDVDGEVWTLRVSDRTITARPGVDPGVSRVSLDAEAFADLICEQRTALGLA